MGWMAMASLAVLTGCSLVVSDDPGSAAQLSFVVEPTLIPEGIGTGDEARRFPLAIRAATGQEFSTSTEVSVSFGQAEPNRCCANCGPSCGVVSRSGDGSWLSVGVGVPVLPDEDEHEMLVTVSDPPREFQQRIEIQALPTLELEGEVDPMTLEESYAAITVVSQTTFTGRDPIRLHATGPIRLLANLVVSGAAGAPGPGGFFSGEDVEGAGQAGVQGGHGGGGGFGSPGVVGQDPQGCHTGTPGGPSESLVGIKALVPLRGGSGGGRGDANGIVTGAGLGGGGGGAIIVSSESSITFNSTAIVANGGVGIVGQMTPACTGSGGGGSGGGVIVQTPRASGMGAIISAGGPGVSDLEGNQSASGHGGEGIGRVDSEFSSLVFAMAVEAQGWFWRDVPLAVPLSDGTVSLEFRSEDGAPFELEVDDIVRTGVEITGSSDGVQIPIALDPGFHSVCLILIPSEPLPTVERERRICTRFVALP